MPSRQLTACMFLHNRADLTELDAKWTGMWQRSSEAAAAVQSEVSRMGGMVFEVGFDQFFSSVCYDLEHVLQLSFC